MAYTETPEAKAIRIERDLARREVLLAGTAEEQTYKPKKKHERVRPKKGGKMNGEAFNNNSNGSARGHQVSDSQSFYYNCSGLEMRPRQSIFSQSANLECLTGLLRTKKRFPST